MSIGRRLLLVVIVFVLGLVAGYAWRDISKGQAPRWEGLAVSLGLQSLATSELDATRTFTEALANVDMGFYGEPDRQNLTYAAIQGMMNSLKDPYTGILPPEEAKKFGERSKGRFLGSGGIGAELTSDPLGARIKGVFKGGPAAAAGLKAEDVIVSVDGRDLAGSSIEDIVTWIRGKEGTVVRLRIHRASTNETFEKVLTRKKVQIQDVYGEILNIPGSVPIGRLQIRSFTETIVKQFDDELEILEGKGIKGLIIDLRDNAGGVMSAPIDIVARFLHGKLVVSVKGRGGLNEKYYARMGLAETKPYPIVVLISESTASAAEILAGALRDYKIGTLVGEHTYGKAAVQKLIELSDGAQIKITIGRYYLPNGDLIQRIETEDGEYQAGGIKPNVEVKLNKGATMGDLKTDNQLQAAVDVILKGQK